MKGLPTLRCFQIFGPVSIFVVARVLTAGGVRKYVVILVHGFGTTSCVRPGSTY
jgi:hypothetical protein